MSTTLELLQNYMHVFYQKSSFLCAHFRFYIIFKPVIIDILKTNIQLMITKWFISFKFENIASESPDVYPIVIVRQYRARRLYIHLQTSPSIK